MIGRYATSRQKACNRCVGAKVRCDQAAGGCGRCEQSGLRCTYPRAAQPNSQGKPDTSDTTGANHGSRISSSWPVERLHSPDGSGGSAAGADDFSQDDVLGASASVRRKRPRNLSQSSPAPSAAETIETSNTLDFSDLDLICPINPDDVANRWINSFVPTPGQVVKAYSPSVSTFIYSVLRSYVHVSMRGPGHPPFVHELQMKLPSSAPLLSCLSLLRTNPVPANRDSDALLTAMLQDQMASIHDRHTTVDHMVLLAGFQAYLLYAMVLFFKLDGRKDGLLRQAMMNLQEIACAACRHGLWSAAEKRGSRPKWEAWLVTEAKRRTLFTMCMFDSVLLANDDMPAFLATELRGLLAPSAKRLWEARDRSDWEVEYDALFKERSGSALTIDELWPMTGVWSGAEIASRRKRVDAWVQDVDEFGMMVFAVTSCTHGG